MSPPLTCTFWLYGLQSAINVGQCLRAAEVFKQRIAIYDAGKILVDHEKIRTISDFACGALQRVPPIDTGPTPCFMPHQRLVATCLDDDAVRLPDFVFQPDDVIVIGNDMMAYRHILFSNRTPNFIFRCPRKFYQNHFHIHPLIYNAQSMFSTTACPA